MKKYIDFYRPGLGESWLIMLAILLLGGALLSAAVVFVVNLIAPGSISATGTGWSTAILYPIPFILVFLFVFLRARNAYQTALVSGRSPFPNPSSSLGKVPLLVFAVLIPVLVVTLSIIMDPLTSWMKMPEFIKDLFEKMTENNFPTFLAVVIAAPLLEEWLVRKIALGGMLQHMAPWKAIMWSALMFGVIHGNPWQAIPAFLMGCLFGWVYYRTRSYWACVSLHAINNGISFLLAYLFPDLPADMSIRAFLGDQPYFISLGISLVLFFAVIYYLHKKLTYIPVKETTYERT